MEKDNEDEKKVKPTKNLRSHDTMTTENEIINEEEEDKTPVKKARIGKSKKTEEHGGNEAVIDSSINNKNDTELTSSSNNSSSTATAVESSAPTQSNTAATAARDLIEAEILCAICMGASGTEIQLLPNHNCPVCVAGAWNVCDCCDDNLLSRTCPVCNSDYSPRVLYVVPNLPTFPIAPEDMTQSVKMKIAGIGRLVTGSNVVVWCPGEQQMHFFLPQEFTEELNSFRSLSVSIPMTEDSIINNTFLFTNKLWDDLMQEMEDGPEGSDEILTSKKTMTKIFLHLHSPNSQLMTQMPPDQWSLFDV